LAAGTAQAPPVLMFCTSQAWIHTLFQGTFYGSQRRNPISKEELNGSNHGIFMGYNEICRGFNGIYRVLMGFIVF